MSEVFSTILHKRSSTLGVTPNLTALSIGEIAINSADGKLFTKSTNNTLKTFLNVDLQPYTLDQTLSSTVFQYGNNTVTDILGSILNGVDNDVSGSGSTVINGSDNDIAANYALIGNGSNNKISVNGEFGAILGGENNNLNHPNSFILGSSITSHLSGFTYVENLSANGKFYGDGSELTGIISGDTETTTLVRANSAEWNIAYDTATAYQTASSTFLTSETDSQTLSFDETNKDLTISNGNTVSLSALIDSSIDTGVRDLTANWQSAYLNQTDYLPLSGGTVTGSLSVLGTSKLNGVTELGSVLNATATIYVDTSKVGINTETPNKELTVVGDVSATGKYYGDGSSLTGITAGDTEATTLVRSQSATWSAMLPLTGGDLTGSLTVAGTISASETISMSGSRVIAGYSQDTTPVYYIRTLTQAEYNAIAVKDDNTIYFIKQ